MCIVVDTCSWGSVFNSSSKNHEEFKPVKEWILHGKGKLVYGGDKYRKELASSYKYLKLFKLLNDFRKVVKIDDVLVNKKEKDLKLVTSPSFNDHHLLAILIVSGCRILCSENTQDFPDLKDKKFYPKGKNPAKIYSKISSKSLIKDCNIADICRPNLELSKIVRDKLMKSFE